MSGKVKVVREEEVVRGPAAGLKDGGQIVLSCSNCRAALMNVWATRPHEPDTWKLQATCPFCGDRSFVHSVRGGFHNGPVAYPKRGAPDEDCGLSTAVDTSDFVGDVILFTIKKAKPDAKPVVVG